MQLLGLIVALPLALYLPMRDGLAADAEEKAKQEKVQNIQKAKYALVYNTRWLPTKITEDQPGLGADPAPPGAVNVEVGLFLRPLDATAVKRTSSVTYELRDAQGRKWPLEASGVATVPNKVTHFILNGTIPRNKFNEVRLAIVPKPTVLRGMTSIPPTARFVAWNA